MNNKAGSELENSKSSINFVCQRKPHIQGRDENIRLNITLRGKYILAAKKCQNNYITLQCNQKQLKIYQR